MTLDEEKALIEQARRQPKAFGVLFDAYYGPIFGYVHRRILDWDISKDVTSEVFLKALTNLSTFRWQGISIAAWLYRIATNEINLYFRHGKTAPSSLQDLDERGFDSMDNRENEKELAEKQIQAHQDFLQIQAVLKTLNIKYQEVIALRYFEDKSIKEIAEILNKNEGTVKSLISRGLEKIRFKM